MVWRVAYGLWAVGYGQDMEYGIGRYIDMETWGDDIMVFAHETPCQGHHTRTYARVTTRDAMPRPTHRAPCQGHRTRKHVRATQGTMPGKCHEEIFQSRHTGDHARAMTRDYLERLHETPCRCHHRRKHIRATTQESMSKPSQEKSCQGHHTRKHVRPTSHGHHTRKQHLTENMSEPSHQGGQVG